MIEYMLMAFDGIWSHKLRSALTMLGIIIGIASIIAISSTIMGTNEQIKQNLIGSGNNAVTIRLYQGDQQYYVEYNPIPEGLPALDQTFVEEVLRTIPEVKRASLYHQREAYGQITCGKATLEGGTLLGVDEHYMKVYDYVIRSGRDFIADDFTQYKKVALIDNKIASSLFQGQSAVGKTLDIIGEPFVIVGVFGQSSTFEPVIHSLEDYYMYMDMGGGKVLVPSGIWPTLYAYDEPASVVVKASSTEDMTAAGQKTTDLLNGYITGETDNIKYKSENLLEQAKELQDLSNATNQQLIWIASISLLVGGIGVMNIMLVSVTERTREIGLKKALGARRRTISMQFLTEAGVLTCLGGLLGVIVGIVLAVVVSRLSMVPIAISVPVMVLAVVFSFVIGLFFGAFPAMKAAKLNPIEALRHE